MFNDLHSFFANDLKAVRISRNAKFVVHVEINGMWTEFDADNQEHALRLAKHWVIKLGADSASCRRVMKDGTLFKSAFHIVEAA